MVDIFVSYIGRAVVTKRDHPPATSPPSLQIHTTTLVGPSYPCRLPNPSRTSTTTLLQVLKTSENNHTDILNGMAIRAHHQ